MKLEVNCTWNDMKDKGKLCIHFAYLPKSIFAMSDEEVDKVQHIRADIPLTGPPVLATLQELFEKNPKSIYMAFVYFQALSFFEYEEESLELFTLMKKKFPKEVLTSLVKAHFLLKEQKTEEFFAHFNKTEVLVGIFPKRKGFFFEEALFFHSLWAQYYYMMENREKHQKHVQFLQLIGNSLKTMGAAVATPTSS